MAKWIDLTGQIFGDFKAIEYLGDKRWVIQCTICGEVKEIQTYNMKKLVGVTCQKKKPPTIVINPGDRFGEWEVLSYEGNKKYLCRCSCGTEKLVLRGNLLNGSSTSCGHNKNHYGDLTGKQINEWTVLGKEGYLYKCQCSCGKIQLVGQKDLISGRSKQCGHGYNIRTDITGQKFGKWTVLKYLGNQMYLCQCSCENHTTKAIRKADLLSGRSTQCGCSKHDKAQQTLLERYGDIGPNRVNNPRTPEQVKAVQQKENLKAFILEHSDLGVIPQTDLATLLGVGLQRASVLVREYGLESLVQFNCTQSEDERNLARWLQSDLGCKVVTRDRQLLDGKEIDIYLPDYKIGIEYDGNYWHSYPVKDMKYHQDKSIQAAKVGIRLIHIFEYEWKDSKIQEKIKNYLYDIVKSDSIDRIYARNTVVSEISPAEQYKFQDKYHLQGRATASIHLGIYQDADKDKKDLLGIMTFGKPRFNSQYEYELVRMCFKPKVIVVGGAQKMFKHFLDMYKPKQILTYSDISKFTGGVYKQMGMRAVQDNPMTVPNYVWVRPQDSSFLNRYQTTKQKLIDSGLGSDDQTENDIMTWSGYVKVYDCGQLKYEYINEEGGMKQ